MWPTPHESQPQYILWGKMSEGWIKLHRKMKEWEWATKPETSHLFIHILLNANHKDGNWRGIPVPAGSYLTGRKSLSSKTGLSERQVRTALNHLKSTSELTIQSTNEYSIISVTNWNLYQQSDQPNANERPAIDQQSTTNKNDNNERMKEDKKVGAKAPKSTRLDFWMKENGIDDIPHEWGMWASTDQGLTDSEINNEWAKFVDYWIANGTEKARKADWRRTWQTWVRNSIEYKSRRK